MIFTSPDEIAQQYFSGRSKLESVPALDLRMIHSEVCAGCGGGPSTRQVGRYLKSVVDGSMLPEWHDVCSSCGKPWEPEPWGTRCVLRGEIQISSRPSGQEDKTVDALDGFRHLRALVEPAPLGYDVLRWQNALLRWELYLHPLMGTEEQVAVFANVSRSTIHRSLEDARGTVWERYLVFRRGLAK